MPQPAAASRSPSSSRAQSSSTLRRNRKTQLWAKDLRGRYEITQWVVWQAANQGPKTGELGHFLRLGEKQGDQSYALRRFSDEVNRLYGVLNNRLYNRRYLAGPEYTIADIISYPWVVGWKAQQQDLVGRARTSSAGSRS